MHESEKTVIIFLDNRFTYTLAVPSSLVSAEELPTSFSETLQTTVSTSENNSNPIVNHEQLAQSLGVTAGTYEELQSDPNAPRKTYYYIEYSTDNNSDNTSMSSESSKSTVTVVPPQDYPKFIENKKREYELLKSDTTVRPFGRGDAGGIGLIVTLRENVKPLIESTAVVDVIVGDTPKVILLHSSFYRSDTRSFRGSYVGSSYQKEFQRSDVRVGASITDHHRVTQTGFYYSSVKLKVFDGTFVVWPVGETDVLSNMILLNSNGVVYPHYYDPHARRVMHEPSTTKYPRGYVHDWKDKDRKDFRENYGKMYPYHTVNWNQYSTEIHHIRPRIWGGDNSFFNLMPLPYHYHRGVVSPWWDAY